MNVLGAPEGSPLDLSMPARIHIVGIGGAGMSAITTVFVAMGHRVTGSDLKPSAAVDRLRDAGVAVHLGHRPENLGAVDLVARSTAVSPDNPEIAEARRRGIPVATRADALAALAALRRGLAVAGTHGKTTTTSMCSLILVEAGTDPSFLIGGDLNENGSNAVWGAGPWLVVEADESDGTFLRLDPDIAVITNIEPDHLDHYGSVDALRDAFEQFCTGRSVGVVAGADDPVAAAVGRRHGAVLVGFAPEADVVVVPLEAGRSHSRFELRRRGTTVVRISLPVPGRHNVLDAALAAVAAEPAGAPFEAAEAALARFAGVARRFEWRGEAAGIRFVDDYAHLPTEVGAALEAAAGGGWDRVVAVFQPHRYSRTAVLADGFADAFTRADVVVVTDVYAAGERPLPGVTGQLVADAVQRAHPNADVRYVPGRDDLRRHLVDELRSGDLCLTLDAGDLTTLPDELQVELRQ